MKDASSESSLTGWTVLITRPVAQSRELAKAVRRLGGDAEEIPLIDIRFRSDKDIARAVRNFAQFDAVAVTSANAVRAFVSAARQQTVVLSGTVLWHTIAGKTAKAAQDAGFPCKTYPGVKKGDAFSQALVRDLKGCSKKILVLRGQLASDAIARTLRKNGHEVTECVCYDTVFQEVPEVSWKKFFQSPCLAILLFSPSAVQSLVQQAGQKFLQRESVCLIAVGSTTAGACASSGLCVTKIAEKPAAEAVIEALVSVALHRRLDCRR